MAEQRSEHEQLARMVKEIRDALRKLEERLSAYERVFPKLIEARESLSKTIDWWSAIANCMARMCTLEVREVQDHVHVLLVQGPPTIGIEVKPNMTLAEVMDAMRREIAKKLSDVIAMTARDVESALEPIHDKLNDIIKDIDWSASEINKLRRRVEELEEKLEKGGSG